MRALSGLIASTTLASLSIAWPAGAQPLSPPMPADVTRLVPATMQQAQERCAQYPTVLALEKSTATPQQKATYWKTAIACIMATDTPLNNAFLAKNPAVPLSNINALVGTAQATLMLVQLQRQPDGKIMLASLESPVVVGSNDPFYDKNGKIAGYYNTPWGIFPVKNIFTDNGAHYVYMGQIASVPSRTEENVSLSEFFFHGWLNQNIFELENRDISHGCIRVPAEFLLQMKAILIVDKSRVLISKTIPPLPPLEAFPITENNQR